MEFEVYSDACTKNGSTERVVYLEGEHVLGVVLPVARSEPELRVEDVGRDDLLEAALAVLAAEVLDQRVVNEGAVRREEARARTQLVEEEQLLILEE